MFCRTLDWLDPAPCVLFADGAGAVWPVPGDRPGVHASLLRADGSQAGILSVPGNVCGGKIAGSPFLQMDGQAVFKISVKMIDEVARATLPQCRLAGKGADRLIPHQANARILEATAKQKCHDPS